MTYPLPAFLDALAPDLDHLGALLESIGGTYRLAKNYELTAWGMYAPEETVTGSGAFMGNQSPSISMKQYEIGINFGWLFN